MFMDSFTFDFNAESTLTNDTSSSQSDLDWTAFQSASSSSSPPTRNSPFSPLYLSQQDDAVAPNNRSIIKLSPHDDEIYFEMEHLFSGLHPHPHHHQQTEAHMQPPVEHMQQETLEATHANINISNQVINDRHNFEPSSPRIHMSIAASERPMNCLPTPLVPRVSSSRSKFYHKLPDHAVKLMQEWYDAHLDDPYPRSPDKKRFITEGNITAQQCRSWFANRRQRLKYVKRNQSKTTVSTRSNHSPKAKFTEMPSVEVPPVTHEHCYYCQQQQQQQQQQLQQHHQQQITLSSSPLSLTIPTTPTTTTTLNVVINQQTVEQLIHNSLRKLLYPNLI